MFTRPIVFGAALALSVPALATGYSYEGPGTCPTGKTTYEMTNYNSGSSARVIWGRYMFCSGKTTLLAMLPGNELWHNDDATDGGFTGKAKVVANGCGAGTNGTVWNVSFDLAEKATNTVPKSPNSHAGDWIIQLVENGVISRGDTRILFTNRPYTKKYGNQIGLGANPIDSDSEFGGAFWFDWKRETFVDNGDKGIWKKVASGYGDFNYDLIECDPGDECPVDVDSPLGPASGYNVYTVADMDVENSDIAGKTAVGGDADVSNYGLNSGGGSGVVLSVAGDFSASNAQLYGGDGEVGGNCTLSSWGDPDGDLDCNVSGVFDAGSTDNKAALDDILDSVAASAVGAPSATLNAYWPQLILDAGSGSGLKVINVDTCDIQDQIETNWSWASDIQGWDIKAASGATLVINMTGDCGDFFFKNGYMGVSGGIDRTNIVWVMQDMTAITIKNISLQGTLFAPGTAVTFNSGNIQGQMVVYSLEGSGESHEFSFDGDICPVEEE